MKPVLTMKKIFLVALLVGVASCVRLPRCNLTDVVEGDMMFTPEQKANRYTKNGMSNEWYRWKGGVIYYQLDSSIREYFI